MRYDTPQVGLTTDHGEAMMRIQKVLSPFQRGNHCTALRKIYHSKEQHCKCAIDNYTLHCTDCGLTKKATNILQIFYFLFVKMTGLFCWIWNLSGPPVSRWEAEFSFSPSTEKSCVGVKPKNGDVELVLVISPSGSSPPYLFLALLLHLDWLYFSWKWGLKCAWNKPEGPNFCFPPHKSDLQSDWLVFFQMESDPPYGQKEVTRAWLYGQFTPILTVLIDSPPPVYHVTGTGRRVEVTCGSNGSMPVMPWDRN